MDSELELMETSRGGSELLEEDKPYDDEERAKDLVETNLKSLEHDLKSITNPKTRVFIQSLITCLSDYYSLKDMQAHMTSTVEQYFNSLFDDELTHNSYMSHSLRCETRRQKAQEKAPSIVQPLQAPDSHYDDLSGVEAIAKDLVSQGVKNMENDIEGMKDKETRDTMQHIIFCVSKYFTMEEFTSYMACACPRLTASHLENIFASFFDDNEVGRNAYLAYSVHCETVRREQQQAPISQAGQPEQAIAKESVAKAVKSLEVALKSDSLTNAIIRGGMQSMITCLSRYYTLEKMKEYMNSTTQLTAAQVEKMFNRHIGNNELTRKSYLEYALRMETRRGQQEEEDVAQPAPVSHSFPLGCKDGPSTSYAPEDGPSTSYAPEQKLKKIGRNKNKRR